MSEHAHSFNVNTKFLTLVETFEGVLVELEGSTAIVWTTRSFDGPARSFEELKFPPIFVGRGEEGAYLQIVHLEYWELTKSEQFMYSVGRARSPFAYRPPWLPGIIFSGNSMDSCHERMSLPFLN